MLGFSLGVLVGMIISLVSTLIVARTITAGTLRIDKSDPQDDPYMFLEISKGVGDLADRKHIILTVSTKSYISQK